MVGSLLYIAPWTKPDICYSVSQLTRSVSNPGNMDLIQVGVSVTCSWKNKSSASVPRWGWPSPPRQVVTTLCTQPVFSNFSLPLFCDLLLKGKSPPKKSILLQRRYGRRSCFAHSSKKSPRFSYVSPKIVLESSPNLHPVIFLQSIGLELFIISRRASDFDLTLWLYKFSLTSTVMPIWMAFLS
jgi:hypothetical protein